MPGSKLILIPSDLGADDSVDWIGPHLRQSVAPLRRFVVEHAREARQFLKKLGLPLQELQFEILDEHSKPQDLDRIAAWLTADADVGLLSEAGCPAIADPGAALVRRAHQLGVQVVPLVGPSSIVMALMASGLNGQRFAFNGYLPQAAADRDARIRAFEERSRQFDQTEIFIEAPYRNDALFAALLAKCRPDSVLSIASGLAGSDEEIASRTIGQWRRVAPPALHKRPTVFLLLAAGAGSANRRGRAPGAK
ncbi:MAG TPA: SAM-dependent methyltransferase [Burkholderiales bacterium]|nr:SAM-dependent methyltransferase [Burkholderiales bacterium]